MEEKGVWRKWKKKRGVMVQKNKNSQGQLIN